MAVWQTPDSWKLGDGFTASALNKISENLNYLLKPDMNIVTIRNGVDVVKTNLTSTPTVVDDLQFSMTFTPKANSRLLLGLNLPVVISATAARIIKFDWLMDDATYLSSMTGTALTNGSIVCPYIDAAGGTAPAVGYVVLDNPEPVTHTFKLRIWANNTTTTTVVLANTLVQMWVREF